MTCILCTHVITGTGDNKGGNNEEGQDWPKLLPLRSVGNSTQKNYISKWNTRVKERKTRGDGPWLHTVDGVNEALTELLEFMTSRCFGRNNQQSIARGCLAAINFFHKMFTGWKLPLFHYIIVAVGKGIDLAHGMSTKKKPSQISLDVGNACGRATGSREYGRRGVRQVARTRRVVVSIVPSVGVVGVRQWTGISRVLSNAETHLFLAQRSAGRWRLRTERSL